jgi:hypothetical protein
MHHPMCELTSVQLRAAPFHSGIGGALAEMRSVDPRHPLDVIESENERFVDKPVQDEPVVSRVNFSDASMVPFEAEPVGGDWPVESVQGREADGAFLRCREPFHVSADHVRFVL